MIVFLTTPRTRLWELSHPTVIGTVGTTNFNHNPVNPNTLVNNHFRQLILAAAQETILDNIVYSPFEPSVLDNIQRINLEKSIKEILFYIYP